MILPLGPLCNDWVTMKMVLRAMREQKVTVESAKKGDRYRFFSLFFSFLFFSFLFCFFSFLFSSCTKLFIFLRIDLLAPDVAIKNVDIKMIRRNNILLLDRLGKGGYGVVKKAILIEREEGDIMELRESMEEDMTMNLMENDEEEEEEENEEIERFEPVIEVEEVVLKGKEDKRKRELYDRSVEVLDQEPRSAKFAALFSRDPNLHRQH